MFTVLCWVDSKDYGSEKGRSVSYNLLRILYKIYVSLKTFMWGTVSTFNRIVICQTLRAVCLSWLLVWRNLNSWLVSYAQWKQNWSKQIQKPARIFWSWKETLNTSNVCSRHRVSNVISLICCFIRILFSSVMIIVLECYCCRQRRFQKHWRWFSSKLWITAKLSSMF